MKVRVFKNRTFRDFADSEGLDDAVLWKTVDEVENGLVDARLGGFLVKKRVPRPGGGKSSGYRTIMAHRQGDRVFLLYGFAKKERENITSRERAALIEAGNAYMRLSNDELDQAAAKKVLFELKRKNGGVK